MRPRLIAIGASLGGMEALSKLLGALAPGFPAAVVIAIHRGKVESGDLLPMLSRICKLPVGFPLDKEIIQPGMVYIAPPDLHMLVEDDHFTFNLDEPVNNARPSIDVLFESAAEACGASLTGIVLTGLGQDGARGLASIHRRDGQALVQLPDEASAPSMPLAALNAVPDARPMSLAEMRAWLARITSQETVP